MDGRKIVVDVGPFLSFPVEGFLDMSDIVFHVKRNLTPTLITSQHNANNLTTEGGTRIAKPPLPSQKLNINTIPINPPTNQLNPPTNQLHVH